MEIMQEADIELSVHAPMHKSDPNGLQRPLVSDPNHTWSVQDNNVQPPANVVVDIIDRKEEDVNDVLVQPFKKGAGNWLDIRTPEPGSYNGVEPEPIRSSSKSEENEHLIPGNLKKKKSGIPQDVILYRAAVMGDWKTAKSIFDIDPSSITKPINDIKDTPLHIAVFANHISFVQKLLQISSSSDLEVKNESGSTALAYAATSGATTIAKLMVDKNPNLPNLHDPHRPTPVLMAVCYKHKNMASYLFSKTDFEALNTNQQFELLIATITTDYYDIALDILMKKPELAKERVGDYGDTALHVLAAKTFSIGSSNELGFWKRHINTRFNGVYQKALMQTLAHQVVERIWNFIVEHLSTPEIHEFLSTPTWLLNDAARAGNVELLIVLIRSYPDLLWRVHDGAKSVFHVAVENRQESVFCLIYEIGGMKDFLANYIDTRNNFNMLHLAGMVASQNHLNRVSGAALQMQR